MNITIDAKWIAQTDEEWVSLQSHEYNRPGLTVTLDAEERSLTIIGTTIDNG